MRKDTKSKLDGKANSRAEGREKKGKRIFHTACSVDYNLRR